ncbi:MAG: LLM class flavin-dependent oxidoreductase, partial [Gammaproteobacteria bacterium]
SPIRSGGTAADALRETVHLARLCEALGYHRFWVAEHHASGSLAGCAPEVLLARLGADTKRIRIGSGGVMLPHYSPYKVAENFKLLETLYPGRVDLGVGRAPGSSPYIAAALAYGSPTADARYFPQKLEDLDALLRDESPSTQGLEQARAYPRTEHAPPLWLLGSSEDSALLAARQGLPYAFAHFINPAMGEDIFRIYRERFHPGPVAGEPYTCLAVFAVCAETEEEARRLSLSRDLWYLKLASGGDGIPFPSVEEAEAYPYTEAERAFLRQRMGGAVIGAPEQVREGLEDRIKRFGADEIMVVSITYDFEARCLSHKLIAEAWNGR